MYYLSLHEVECVKTETELSFGDSVISGVTLHLHPATEQDWLAAGVAMVTRLAFVLMERSRGSG